MHFYQDSRAIIKGNPITFACTMHKFPTQYYFFADKTKWDASGDAKCVHGGS